MNLRIGQSVYVGYTTKVDPAFRHLRCSIGTIISGPYLGRTRVHTGWMTGPAWEVRSEGERFVAKERILFPIDDNIVLETDEAEATA